MSSKQAKYARRQTAEAADIGQIPRIKNPARRELARTDLHVFLVEYFPNSTGLKPFSSDHCRAISRLQGCIIEGGRFGEAMPRGFAKTTIAENSVLWAVLYGYRKYCPIFGADASAAEGNIDSIKRELSENDLLMEDFPEICHAIRALEGKPQRCGSQTHLPGDVEDSQHAGEEAKLTHIEWTSDTIVLPTIHVPAWWTAVDVPNGDDTLVLAAGAGGIITSHGILASSRGMKHKRPDGTQQRPDFVFLDDPQTDQSARSPAQVVARLNQIKKGILKLGGHSAQIAVFCAMTVIERNDLADQLLDPKRNPAWQGERIAMVKKWATRHDTLWLEDYARLRNEYNPDVLGDQRRAHKMATDFYRDNRAAMDDGAEVAWEFCYDSDTELSAVQHAYNLLIDDGADVFASECQNQPLAPADQTNADAPDPKSIALKTNGFDRGEVPADVSRIVSFVDVGKKLLYWMVCGFADDFSGAILDYGTWPDQKRAYFSAADAKIGLLKATKSSSMEEAVYAGLDTLTNVLAAREWKRADGAILRLERGLIDANWGESTDTVYKFCRQSPHAALLAPSHGRGVGATSTPFSQYTKKPGDRVGLGWRMPATSQRRAARYVIFDSNFWKSFAHSRLSTAMGAKGCLALFGDHAREPDQHQLVIDHFCAEYPTLVEAKGRTVSEWRVRATRPDNHLLDCLVGCCVAGSMQGCELNKSSAAIAARKKLKLSDLQKQKREKQRHG